EPPLPADMYAEQTTELPRITTGTEKEHVPVHPGQGHAVEGKLPELRPGHRPSRRLRPEPRTHKDLLRGAGHQVTPPPGRGRVPAVKQGRAGAPSAGGPCSEAETRSRVPHPAPPAACRHLGTYDLLRLERLRSVGGVPLSRVRTWLPAARVAGLTTQMLHDASLHRVLRRRFGLFPTNARHQVRAVPADPRMAHDL